MKKRFPATMLPVIIPQGVYARAVLAAEQEGKSLADYVETALLSAVHVTNRQAAHTTQQQPFVRPAGGVASYDQGRPSSRQFQAGQTSGGGVNSAVGGSEAAGAQRRSEHPPVDAAEHSGTRINRKHVLHL